MSSQDQPGRFLRDCWVEGIEYNVEKFTAYWAECVSGVCWVHVGIFGIGVCMFWIFFYVGTSNTGPSVHEPLKQNLR